MPRSQPMEKNPRWKGGRVVQQNGYVVVKVGKQHHLADCRGYALEHRIVAEQILGRRLKSGEQVHHRNGNSQDNRPENLQIFATDAHHKYLHRKRADLPRKAPQETNLIVQCKCGCGATFPKYDQKNRPRTYVTGHNFNRGNRKDRA